MRNPYGQSKDKFTGAWNSESPEWANVSDELKKELKFLPNNSDRDNGGVFFMLFDEFVKSFENLDFVHVNLNAFFTKSNDYNFDVNWKCQQMIGEWSVNRKTAGGCGNTDKEDFWLNPQMVIPPLALENKNDKYVSAIVALMQTNTMQRRQMETNGSYIGVNLPINFTLFKVKNTPTTTTAVNYAADQLEKVADCCSPNYLSQRFLVVAFIFFFEQK